jgi:hypothetical protein
MKIAEPIQHKNSSAAKEERSVEGCVKTAAMNI